MDFISKVKNILMPLEEVEDDTFVDEAEEKPVVKSAHKTAEYQVANGETIAAASAPSYDSNISDIKINRSYSKHTKHNKRKGNEDPDMRILVFTLNAFDDVKEAADALKQKRALVVNYEMVDTAVQKRSCDFINGVCYVLNGEVKRITKTMVLYVPENVSISSGLVRRDVDGIFASQHIG